MKSLSRRTLALALLVAAMLPAALAAQTPEASDPTVPYTIEHIGAVETGLDDYGTPRAASNGGRGIHTVMTVTIEPGKATPELNGMRSAIVVVQEGELTLSLIDGEGTVSEGTGDPVAVPDPCDRRACPITPGQEVTLGPGNGFSTRGGSFGMASAGDEPVVLTLSVVIPDSVVGGRCWICPVVTN